MVHQPTVELATARLKGRNHDDRARSELESHVLGILAFIGWIEEDSGLIFAHSAELIRFDIAKIINHKSATLYYEFVLTETDLRRLLVSR